MGLSLSWSFNRWVSWEQHCYMYILRIHSLMYHVKHDICKVFFLKVSHTLCFGHILALSYSSNDVFQCLWTLRGDSAGRKEEILTQFWVQRHPLTVGLPLACLLSSSCMQISQSLRTLSLPSFQPQLQAGFHCFCQVLYARASSFFLLTVNLFHLKVFMTPSIEVYKMGIEIKYSLILLGIHAI